MCVVCFVAWFVCITLPMLGVLDKLHVLEEMFVVVLFHLFLFVCFLGRIGLVDMWLYLSCYISKNLFLIFLMSEPSTKSKARTVQYCYSL